MPDIREVYGIFMRRVITGVLLGAVVGSIEMAFFNHDFYHLLAAVAAGTVYMAVWVLLIEWFQLAGGKIVLGAVSGLMASIVWWAIANPVENIFVTAAVAGACFGAAYAWSDQRMT